MAFGFRDNALSRGLTRIFGATTPATTRTARTPQEIEEFFRSGSDDAVTTESALRVASVYACVRLLSASQAMLPLQLFARDGARRTLAEDHPVSRVLAAPNRWQTPFDFEVMMSAHKHLRGNAFAYVSRIGNRVVELLPLNPEYVTVEQTSELDVIYRYRKPGRSEIVYSQAEIHHRRGLTTDGLLGLSPISAARKAIRLAMQTEKHGSALFKNSARPSGVLKSPNTLTPDAAARLKESFASAYEGEDNAHKTLVLEEGLEWQQISMSAEDSQFIESRKFQRNEIAMFYGVPPHMIGDVERGTSWGSGIEQQSLGFLVHTLNPHLVTDQQSLARDLLSPDDRRRHVIAHDTSILTRAEFATRQNGLEIQLRNGVINPNEWRQIEGLNPRADPQGDDYARPGGAAAAQQASQRPAAPADQGGSAR